LARVEPVLAEAGKVRHVSLVSRYLIIRHTGGFCVRADEELEQLDHLLDKRKSLSRAAARRILERLNTRLAELYAGRWVVEPASNAEGWFELA
jgi:hypothetical protein